MATSTPLVAEHFRVSHIPAATIPNSRLSNILSKMHQGQTLTKHSLNFLQQQSLPELYRLACGEITHEAYVAELDPNYLIMNQKAYSVNQAKETERQALASHYLAQKHNRSVRKNVQKLDSEAERQFRRKREREATEAVLAEQRARQAEWKAQRERNCELAATAYHSRVNTQGYCEPTALDVARHFHLEHVNAAVCTPLGDILETLFRGRSLTDDELTYLRHSVFLDLYRLAFGQLSLDEYITLAKTAQTHAFAYRARKEAAEAARIARENDPKYIAMMQTQALYEKYEVSLTDDDESLKPRMTKVLQQTDRGERLSSEDLKWLGTSAKRYFTAPLRKAYHRLEADFHADQHQRTRDPWNAINACAHYRKSEQSEIALQLIDSIARDRIKQPKVQSAALTTRGGVMRDLSRSPEAIKMGEKAHALTPQDYRPCTLLGAVHMELRNFETGHYWYEEARKRGAPELGIDSELRSIFQQLDSAGREAMKSFLLAEDSHRYSWLEETRYQIAKKQSSGNR